MKIKAVMSSLMVLGGLVFASASTQAEDAQFKIGDQAPKLQVGSWVQGEQVQGFAPGTAYIVEFWATWSGPSRAWIPAMNELNAKVKDQGVVVIGLNVWEKDDSLVAPFVKKMGDKMTYRVALDDKNSQSVGAMAATWMTASGLQGIPSAFVINRQGQIAWMGHPMKLNEALVSEVTSTNYDLAKAAEEYAQEKASEEMAACKKNLETIGAAIDAYRKDHNDIPNGLSDLVPKYLTDTNALVCPICKRTGEKSSVGVLDTNVYSSYLFEFAPVPMPAAIKNAFPGVDMTMRDWKRQQMEVAGTKVPIVRCFLHLPIALNLSYGGEVYESPQLWEDLFEGKVERSAFNPH